MEELGADLGQGIDAQRYVDELRILREIAQLRSFGVFEPLLAANGPAPLKTPQLWQLHPDIHCHYGPFITAQVRAISMSCSYLW
jgi:hypothetical protein